MIDHPMARKRTNRRRGAAAVEFALVAPLFFALLFGIIEFGRVMMVQQLLVNASRSGAREASLPDSTNESVAEIVIAELARSSITLTASNVTVTPDPASANDDDQINVVVSVPYTEISWVGGSFFNGLLSASTSMRAERMN